MLIEMLIESNKPHKTMKTYIVTTSDGDMKITANSIEDARNKADMIIRHESGNETIEDITEVIED